jgi:hypothetical protein
MLGFLAIASIFPGLSSSFSLYFALINPGIKSLGDRDRFRVNCVRHHPVLPNRVSSRRAQVGRLCRDFRYRFCAVLVSAEVRCLFRRFRGPGLRIQKSRSWRTRLSPADAALLSGAIPAAFTTHKATPVSCHEGVGNLAVFAESSGGADLVTAHKPRVACHVSGDYGC